MKKPRILMLIKEYLPIFSGHAIYLQAILPKFIADGYAVKILTCDFQRLPPYECIDGVDVHRLPFDPQSPKWEALLTLRILRFLFLHRHEFDVLHFHGHMDYYGALTLFCKCFRKKIIMQMVLMGADDPESLRDKYKMMSLRLKILAHIDRFIHISRPLGESCLRAGFSGSRLRYIPQGVDIERFRPLPDADRKRLREQLQLDPEGHVVTFVGAIIERKGVDILIEAWSEVQRAFPAATLILIGPCEFGADDANARSLQAFVQDIQAQIENQHLHVAMIGRSSLVPSYLQVSDLFVLPSRKEGFGNVILEAMACGVPPIVAYMDGVALESVTPDETGIIIHTKEELAAAIMALLDEESRRKAMGMRARREVLDRFALDRIARQYLAVYDEVMNEKVNPNKPMRIHVRRLP